MRFSELDASLRDALARPLPGLAAQLRMAPRPRPPAWQPDVFPEEARRAAALVLVYPVENRPHLVLTLRASDLPFHRGQVSLPGGAIHAGESIEEAARREAREEIGLQDALVCVLGRLTPVHISVSGFVLWPVIATAAARPPFAPDAREVARLLEVPVELLAHPARLRRETRLHDGQPIEVPYFDLSGERVWGATAMVISELLHLIGMWRADGR